MSGPAPVRKVNTCRLPPRPAAAIPKRRPGFRTAALHAPAPDDAYVPPRGMVSDRRIGARRHHPPPRVPTFPRTRRIQSPEPDTGAPTRPGISSPIDRNSR